jgi:ATPase subunit of ABC transporter with duplicated ATPase domains
MKTRGTQNSRAQGTPAPGGGGAGEVAIRVRGLRKRYGDVEAVRGIDLTVHKGEIFAFLGPNGAGDDDRRDAGGLPVPRRRGGEGAGG